MGAGMFPANLWNACEMKTKGTTVNPALSLLIVLLLTPLDALHAADAPKPLAVAETDARLHADGKGWRLDKAKVTDPKRPRVLLIGDSILNGYLNRVTALLDGKTYVDAWVNPYCQSESLNKLLAEVLAQGPYDLVHFNMGLHGWPEGRIKPGTFEPLTKAYVEVLKAKLPKAKLIWASSTPVTAQGKPTELEPGINPIIIEHNRMAAKVMAETGVPVNDFYSLLVNKRELARGDRFHWTAPAYELLAKTVVESVLQELGKSKTNGVEQTKAMTTPWEKIRAVPMSGDLRVFWDVGCRDRDYNREQAVNHGLKIVDLLGTYSDYPGKQKENISKFLEGNRTNPWKKPEYFERIIKRNIASGGGKGAIFVHDIEFGFEEDVEKAWADEETRKLSGAETREQFAAAYFREWATWFSLPCVWAKQQWPREPVGLYGPQPFRRDYWGIAGKNAKQIDGTHVRDAELWKHIDPFVDFYIASVYVFYDDPGSIYYMASNIEENVARTRSYGNKPLYAYEWLRYHDSNKKLAGQELAPYLVEAMAVLPFFSGARGLVLWGWEPKGKGQCYERLPLFMNSLGRVSDLSAKIAAATLAIDEPAHVLWKEKRPLVRKLCVTPDEWIVMAVNPWQDETEKKDINVQCGTRSVLLTLDGRHTDIIHIQGSRVMKR